MLQLDWQDEGHLICHLEALNAIVALWKLALMHQGQLLHLFTDSATVAVIFHTVSAGMPLFMHILSTCGSSVPNGISPCG